MLKHRVKDSSRLRGEGTVQTGRVRQCLHTPKKNQSFWNRNKTALIHTPAPRKALGREGGCILIRNCREDRGSSVCVAGRQAGSNANITEAVDSNLKTMAEQMKSL